MEQANGSNGSPNPSARRMGARDLQRNDGPAESHGSHLERDRAEEGASVDTFQGHALALARTAIDGYLSLLLYRNA